jgi:hypothetical protein
MKVGKIEFGHCAEPIRIKGRKHNIDGTVTDTLFAELDDKPDYVIPQFSDRCNKLMKELDTTQSKILSQPYKKDKSCANPYPQKPDALSKQVGGSHYKQYKIQPFEFFLANQIPHHKATVIRRIMRYDHPTGKGLEDLKKIKHEIDLIIQLENWEGKSGEPTAEKKG